MAPAPERGLPAVGTVSTIDFPPVPDRHHQHHETVIFDGSNDAEVADAIAPESLSVAGQRMTEAARITAAGYAFAQIAQHAAFVPGISLRKSRTTAR